MSRATRTRGRQTRVAAAAPRELILMMEEENRTANRMGDYTVKKYYDVVAPVKFPKIFISQYR